MDDRGCEKNYVAHPLLHRAPTFACPVCGSGIRLVDVAWVNTHGNREDCEDLGRHIHVTCGREVRREERDGK